MTMTRGPSIERGAGHAPGGDLRVEILDKIFLPDDLTGLDFEAEQRALGAENVNMVAVHGGSGAGADGVGLHQADVVDVPFLGPEDATGFLVQAEEAFGPLGVQAAKEVGDEDASSGDGRAGEPAVDGRPP